MIAFLYAFPHSPENRCPQVVNGATADVNRERLQRTREVTKATDEAARSAWRHVQQTAETVKGPIDASTWARIETFVRFASK